MKRCAGAAYQEQCLESMPTSIFFPLYSHLMPSDSTPHQWIDKRDGHRFLCLCCLQGEKPLFLVGKSEVVTSDLVATSRWTQRLPHHLDNKKNYISSLHTTTTLQYLCSTTLVMHACAYTSRGQVRWVRHWSDTARSRANNGPQ